MHVSKNSVMGYFDPEAHAFVAQLIQGSNRHKFDFE